MGFFHRLFGSNDKPAAANLEPTPEPLPKFPYELKRGRDAKAVLSTPSSTKPSQKNDDMELSEKSRAILEAMAKGHPLISVKNILAPMKSGTPRRTNNCANCFAPENLCQKSPKYCSARLVQSAAVWLN